VHVLGVATEWAGWPGGRLRRDAGGGLGAAQGVKCRLQCCCGVQECCGMMPWMCVHVWCSVAMFEAGLGGLGGG